MPEPSDAPALAGSLEYAAEVKDAFSHRLERFKEQLRATNGDDLICCIFGVAYENDAGLCFGQSADDPNLLLNLMACSIHELADTVYQKIYQKEQFLPEGNRTPYRRVVADITKQLLMTIRAMSRDKEVNKPSSIILPNVPHDAQTNLSADGDGAEGEILA